MLHLTAADWQFCGRWTLATVVAIALAAALGPLGLFTGPLILAIAQGWVLRPYWAEDYLWWGMATLLGGGLSILVLVIGVLVFSTLPLPLMIFVGGAIIGGGQALVLRRNSRRWVWWPLINGLILTVSLFWYLPDVLDAAIYGQHRATWEWVLRASLVGLIGGALKGVALTQYLHPARG